MMRVDHGDMAGALKKPVLACGGMKTKTSQLGTRAQRYSCRLARPELAMWSLNRGDMISRQRSTKQIKWSTGVAPDRKVFIIHYAILMKQAITTRRLLHGCLCRSTVQLLYPRPLRPREEGRVRPFSSQTAIYRSSPSSFSSILRCRH